MHVPKKSSKVSTRSITLSREEYELLASRAKAYERIQTLVRDDFFAPPPTHDPKKVVADLQRTGKYSAAFLKSVGRGLKRSSYFK